MVKGERKMKRLIVVLVLLLTGCVYLQTPFGIFSGSTGADVQVRTAAGTKVTIEIDAEEE